MDGLTYGPLKQGGMGSDWSEKGWNSIKRHGYFKSIKNLCDAIL